MNDLHTKHLDQVDPADEEGHQASEDGGEDVKEDQGEQVDCGLTEVVNLLPLKIVAFHITCGQTKEGQLSDPKLFAKLMKVHQG